MRPLFLFFIAFCLTLGLHAKEQPNILPDFEKKLKKATLLDSSGKGINRSWTFRSAETFEALKKQVTTLLGPEWEAIPAPPRTRPNVQPGQSNPFGGIDETLRPRSLGDARWILTTKKLKKPLMLSISLAPDASKPEADPSLLIMAWEAFASPGPQG